MREYADNSSVLLVDLVHTRYGVDGRGAVPLLSRTQTQKSHASPRKGYTTLPIPEQIL
jgi:hypothetical protein